MVVNLGNAHTFAALVQADRLWGIYEHHTGLLDPGQAICPAGQVSDGRTHQ